MTGFLSPRQHILAQKGRQKAHATQKQRNPQPAIEKRNHPVWDKMRKSQFHAAGHHDHHDNERRRVEEIPERQSRFGSLPNAHRMFKHQPGEDQKVEIRNTTPAKGTRTLYVPPSCQSKSSPISLTIAPATHQTTPAISISLFFGIVTKSIVYFTPILVLTRGATLVWREIRSFNGETCIRHTSCPARRRQSE